LIERLRTMARNLGGPAVVMTFDPHPVRLLRPEAAPPPLTWTERKADLLGALGIDAMIAYPTDEALLSMTANEFFDRIVRERLGARAMVEGPNFYFGRNRAGDVQVLVFGGSQGAHAINLAMVEAAPRLAAGAGRLAVTHQTGERDVELVRSGYREASMAARVVCITVFMVPLFFSLSNPRPVTGGSSCPRS